MSAKTKIFLSGSELTPSNYTKNSVFNLLEASCSWLLLAPMIESISSKNITDGALSLAS